MVSTGPMPKAMAAEFHISRQATLTACGRSWPPQSRRRGKPVPAGRGPGAIGLLPARRGGDGAVLEDDALAVADHVERGDHLGRELAGFLEHGVDDVFGEVAVDAVVERLLEARRRA